MAACRISPAPSVSEPFRAAFFRRPQSTPLVVGPGLPSSGVVLGKSGSVRYPSIERFARFVEAGR